MIRAYQPDDSHTLMDIGNRAWHGIFQMYRELYGEDLFARMMPNVESRKGEEVRRYCEKNPDCVFVCEEEGRIVGFVTFRIDGNKGMGEIGNNAVDPDCGLKGIGQQMYRAVLDHFRKLGLAFAMVNTGLDEAHAPARRAYERAGFDIRQEDITYYMKL